MVGAHAPPASTALAAWCKLTGALPPAATEEPSTSTHPSENSSGANHSVQLLYCPALFLNPFLSESCNECCVDVQGDKPGRWVKIEIMDLFHPQHSLLSAETSVEISVKARSQDTLSSLASCLSDV
jgi:hypothetical protein